MPAARPTSSLFVPHLSNDGNNPDVPLKGFGASFFSFAIFFFLAVISAISVVLTLLGVLYGGAIGGVVGAVNVATNNALRLEEKKREDA